MKHVVPECFIEGEKDSLMKIMRKTENYTAPRSTMNDPEYLTLHKLLSFLHGALLMKGQLIFYSDLTRYASTISEISVYLIYLYIYDVYSFQMDSRGFHPFLRGSSDFATIHASQWI
jgi:hypothetical protein